MSYVSTPAVSNAPRFIVMSKSTCPAISCWGTYRRVAVVKVTIPGTPAMISRRARGVEQIVQRWENCHVGKTERSAFGRAMAQAQALADRLNAELAASAPIAA